MACRSSRCNGVASLAWCPATRAVWWLILHGIILRVRPRRSAAKYRKIWTEKGSPLLSHTRDQAQALQHAMRERCGERVIVDFAMRYGAPDIAGTLQSMLDRGVTKLLVLPLYPQYGGATTGSTFDALAADFTRRRWLPEPSSSPTCCSRASAPSWRSA